MIYTTLNRIRAHSPCATGWKKLLMHLGKTESDDELLAMTTVLDSNGLDDALWCLRAEPQHAAIWRLLAVHYARQVQHLLTDPRSIAALDVAERHAHGLATDDELDAAWGSAWAAAWDAAWYAARDAARAAAWYAAWGAARDAAWYAARCKQAADLRTVLCYYSAEPGMTCNKTAASAFGKALARAGEVK
jgi:hypothetical protein